MRDEREWGEDEIDSPATLAPFVDVMMVLLVVFIAIAPAMTEGIEIDLPTVGGTTAPTAAEALTVEVDAEGGVWLDAVPIPADRLEAVLAEAAQAAGPAAIVRADADTAYRHIANLMSVLRDVGLSEVGFIVEPVP